MNIAHRSITTMTSREFNQDTAKAKRAALHGPVLVTDRGKPSHVLLTKEEYDRLSGGGDDRAPRKSLVDVLNHPESADIDFDIPEFKGVFKGFELK